MGWTHPSTQNKLMGWIDQHTKSKICPTQNVPTCAATLISKFNSKFCNGSLSELKLKRSKQSDVESVSQQKLVPFTTMRQHISWSTSEWRVSTNPGSFWETPMCLWAAITFWRPPFAAIPMMTGARARGYLAMCKGGDQLFIFDWEIVAIRSSDSLCFDGHLGQCHIKWQHVKVIRYCSWCQMRCNWWNLYIT